ncbi:hypothetical protein MLD38_007320 [Melastoma candidum]|uniref:Uncharacterized protein n=1 Tax=Melastoma candidum TaxID=119954 RepID=A0ACB9RQ88_9MYRT|nr:hypothetical protein MLD38_007320 [Melastoma candidum]
MELRRPQPLRLARRHVWSPRGLRHLFPCRGDLSPELRPPGVHFGQPRHCRVPPHPRSVNNSLNGTVPASLFSAAELRVLDLSNNGLSGEIPGSIVGSGNLQLLNLSYNGLTGSLPGNLTALRNLTVISLRNNYFGGGVPDGFSHVQLLDISSNLINGTLPPDFGSDDLRYLNMSHNRISGEIPPEFGRKIPGNTTLDLSFNNITGQIPESAVLLNQDSGAYSAIAAFPVNSTEDGVAPGSAAGSKHHSRAGLRPFTIASIVVADMAGILVIAVVLLCVYQMKKKKRNPESSLKGDPGAAEGKDAWSSTSSESRGFTRWSCLRKKGYNEDASSGTAGSDSDDYDLSRGHAEDQRRTEPNGQQHKEGTLVTVDGEKALELDNLLKASAYILGATGSSIMYKAVLEDGTTLAVRRIGETGVERFKDFENSVRAVAKLSHPNLVRVRGFYWGLDEKLIIYDFVPNGSLANARYRKAGSSPCHLPWEVRLRIARGMARALAYLHERKHVHGNLKPSNVLLGADMEPRIGDFGLERLMPGDTSYKAGGSARTFGSKRSTASRDSFQDMGPGLGPSPSPSSVLGVSPYHAPESLRSIKPNPKWDAYSFGVILLELIAGKVVTVDESGQVNGVAVEDPGRAVRMVDVAIRGEVEGREEAVLACFRLGLSCASPVPQKRPFMKEAVHVLDKITSSSSSSSTSASQSHYYGHS